MIIRFPSLAKAGLLAGVLVLVSSGAADAHVFGRMEATGNAGGVSVGISGVAPACDYAAGSPTGGATATASGGSVTLTVTRNLDVASKDTCRQLAEGDYEVRFWGGARFLIDSQGRYVAGGRVGNYPGDCRVEGVVIGIMQVKGRGTGSGGPYALPDNLTPNGPSDASALCVLGPVGKGYESNFVPLTIVA